MKGTFIPNLSNLDNAVSSYMSSFFSLLKYKLYFLGSWGGKSLKIIKKIF